MGQIKIYSALKSGKVHFDGSKVDTKDIGSLSVEAHPSLSNRIIIKSNTLFKRGSDTQFRVFFRKLNINRIQNEAGENLTQAPYNMDRDAIIAYVNEQITKPIVTEYFEYNPTTDRLVAQKDIEVQKNGFFLGGKHKIASGNSNIYFEDLDNRANAYPIFGEVLDQSLSANQVAGQGVTKPKSRIFGDFQSVPLGGTPVDDTSIPYDGNNFFPFNISGVGITTRVAEVVLPTQQLKYEIVINGISVYVQYLEHNGLAVNEDLTWYFEQPLDVENGTTLRATIYKVSTVNNQEQNDGILLVCEGDDVNTRYQTNVLSRFFEDEEIALKSDVNQLLSGSTYKGGYDAVADFPALPTGSDVLGDFYRCITADGIYEIGDILVFNGTTYDLIQEEQATQSDIKNSGLKIYDIYVKAGYAGAVRDGSVLYPYADLATAIGSTNDGDSIYLEGSFEIASEIILPQDKSLYFYGSDDACISFTNYSDANGSLLYFDGLDNTKEFKFRNIKFHNAGGYGLYLKKTAKVTIEDCEFKNNGWNGTALNTILPSTTTALLGYDSSSADLQAFYAGSNASNGGAMRIEEATQVLITGNTITNNLRGLRVQDCGINGGGVISRNQSTQNIESGIYIAAGSLGGCQNITTTMNVSAYNANNGLLVIGGLNNKFSQNEVNGNWNAGFCAWGAGNTTLRDSGLYDNNRSEFNGVGDVGDAKASIQINEDYNLLGTQISLNPNFRFIAEILDTQVHYTGLGSNTEKIGFLITSAVGQLADNAKNIIKVDDVGFIGQDYAIDLSEVDITNLRLSLGDNSYQSIGSKAVKAPLAGNYSELPFSNHVMEVPSVDVVVDTLKQSISLTEGVGGNTINVYAINELKSNVVGSTIQIIQNNSDKIQLRGLTFGNIYINGVVAGNNLNSANDSLNAAFSMNLVNYKDFLVSEVGVNGDSSSGGSLPAIANNWYVSYGSQAGTQVQTATIGNTFRNENPFYNGEALEKGHEFVWTIDGEFSFMIGIWGAAEQALSGSDAILPQYWAQGFGFNGAANNHNHRRWLQTRSSGVTIESSGSTSGSYNSPTGQIAIRFGQDNYLYLYEIVSGGYSLIGKSNDTIAGTSVMIQWASFNEGSFPIFTERTETWEIVHDTDSSQNGEWSNGLEQSTIIRSRVSVSPGEKLTLNFNYFGRSEKIGFGYGGAATGVANAEDTIVDGFFYNTSEIIKEIGASESNWTWNTSAANSYDPNGDRSDIGYDGRLNQSNNLGLISFRYNSNNSLEMWHETNNELIATKKVDLDGSAFKVYLGAAENNHTADRIPQLLKYDMSAEEEGASLTGWYYIESPDGDFYYPLFATQAEANYIDSLEGGSGSSHSHTFVDDVYDGGNNTWYMPDTNGVHVGANAPQGGIFGNSINVVWNEIPTGDDSNYLPTFTNITYNVQEGSAINIQYKAQGMTDTFNVTNVPNGYADNGYAIIGTAEDITNGYGQSITHVLNVTKANYFGSVQGTITINVKANLAGNEFTLVDEAGAIKFTQDGGLTVLDFNTVTFNAGSTYRFYLDGSTLQTNDYADIVDANGSGITGNDGLSQSGGSGPGYAGTYLQYVIPSDVAPGKFIKFIDGATSTTYTNVPLTIAGSTYSETVTGVTKEGPSANFTGTVIDTGLVGWLSIDDTMTNGQRMVFDSAFITDLHDSMPDYSMVFFGFKSSTWSNTASPMGAFQGLTGIRFYKSSASVGLGGIYILGYANNSTTSQQYTLSLSNAQAFIEVTSTGNNVRVGHHINSTSESATTTPYGEWSNQKVQTGSQNYGLSTVEPVVYWDAVNGNTEGWDYSDVDWTGLSEIANPTTATSLTNWTKALDFSGSNEHAKQVNSASSTSPLTMMGTSVTTIAPATSGYTSNDSNSKPWATAIVFKSDFNSSNQHIWNQGEGASSTNDNIYLRTDSNGLLYFGWGRSGALNECRLGGQAITGWRAVYIAHTGERLSGSNATASNLADCFDIRIANESNNWVMYSNNLSTAANWITTGGRMDRSVDGYFTVGGRYSNRNFHGKVASMVVTTLRKNQPMPTPAEAEMMMKDPMRWITDYKEGNPFRITFSGTEQNFDVAGSRNYTEYYSTQVWLMGDGTYDSYANGIRNEVYPTDQNITRLQLNSMVSNDIENVSISGLS